MLLCIQQDLSGQLQSRQFDLTIHKVSSAIPLQDWISLAPVPIFGTPKPERVRKASNKDDIQNRNSYTSADSRWSES